MKIGNYTNIKAKTVVMVSEQKWFISNSQAHENRKNLNSFHLFTWSHKKKVVIHFTFWSFQLVNRIKKEKKNDTKSSIITIMSPWTSKIFELKLKRFEIRVEMQKIPSGDDPRCIMILSVGKFQSYWFFTPNISLINRNNKKKRKNKHN